MKDYARLRRASADVGSPLYCETTGAHLKRMAPLVATKLLELEQRRNDTARDVHNSKSQCIGLKSTNAVAPKIQLGGHSNCASEYSSRRRGRNDVASGSEEMDVQLDRMQYARLLGQLKFDVQVVSRDPSRSPLVYACAVNHFQRLREIESLTVDGESCLAVSLPLERRVVVDKVQSPSRCAQDGGLKDFHVEIRRARQFAVTKRCVHTAAI